MSKIFKPKTEVHQVQNPYESQSTNQLNQQSSVTGTSLSQNARDIVNRAQQGQQSGSQLASTTTSGVGTQAVTDASLSLLGLLDPSGTQGALDAATTGYVDALSGGGELYNAQRRQAIEDYGNIVGEQSHLGASLGAGNQFYDNAEYDAQSALARQLLDAGAQDTLFQSQLGSQRAQDIGTLTASQLAPYSTAAGVTSSGIFGQESADEVTSVNEQRAFQDSFTQDIFNTLSFEQQQSLLEAVQQAEASGFNTQSHITQGPSIATQIAQLALAATSFAKPSGGGGS